jgi:hypothetical protein
MKLIKHSIGLIYWYFKTLYYSIELKSEQLKQKNLNNELF